MATGNVWKLLFLPKEVLQSTGWDGVQTATLFAFLC